MTTRFTSSTKFTDINLSAILHQNIITSKIMIFVSMTIGSGTTSHQIKLKEEYWWFCYTIYGGNTELPWVFVLMVQIPTQTIDVHGLSWI